jgi:two-component system, OmpR family, phosphate regulon sensor histidine kinase PhoR
VSPGRRHRPVLGFALLAVATGTLVAVAFAVHDARRAHDGVVAQLTAAVTSLAAEAEPLFGEAPGGADRVIRRWAAASGDRVTLITADGRVHADSWTLPELLGRLENHASRPEVLAAARGRLGVAGRRSATTDTPTVYVAMVVGDPVAPAGYLRLARPDPSARIPWGALAALLVACGIGAAAFRSFEERRHREVARRLEPWSDLPPGSELAALADDADRTFRARRELLERELDALRAALAEVAEGVLLLDREAIVRHANLAAVQLLGPSLGTGRPLVEVVRDPDLLTAVAAVLRGGKRSHTTIPGRDGAELAVRVCAFEHPLLAAAVLLRDVSGERMLERARRALVADLSHELRTPLTVLGGIAEELGEVPDTAEIAAVLERQVRRLRIFAEDLEQLVAIESGRVLLQHQRVDAGSVVRQVLQDLQPDAARAGVVLAHEGDEAPLETDPVRLGQILTNLVGNGIRFNRSGGRVLVRTCVGQGEVTVAVADDGIGIPESELPLVFQRFYRVRRGAAPEGSGLGLAIVKHLTHALGGAVRIESQEGAGTTVTVTLPAAAGPAPS